MRNNVVLFLFVIIICCHGQQILSLDTNASPTNKILEDDDLYKEENDDMDTQQNKHGGYQEMSRVSSNIGRQKMKDTDIMHEHDSVEKDETLPLVIQRNGISYIQETGDPEFYNFPDPFYQYENVTVKELQNMLGIAGKENQNNSGGPRCFKNECGGYPMNMYMKYYPRLFYTLREIQKLDEINRKKRNVSRQPPESPLLEYTPLTTPMQGTTEIPTGESSLHPPGRPGGGGQSGGSQGGLPGNAGQSGGGVGGTPGSAGPEEPADHDGDNCCPTILSHSNASFLKNVDGVERELVQFIGGEPAYKQYIPVGECVSEKQRGCALCKIQQRLHFLLVMDPDSVQFPPVKFDKFFINSYCSCQAQ